MASTAHVGNALADLITPLVKSDGMSASRLPRVSLLCLGRHQVRTPLMYEPSLTIIAQGPQSGLSR